MGLKIDETNIAIMKHLREGRKSFKAIAEALALTENTVRARVGKLQEEGLLEVSGLVDPEGIPDHRLIYVGVKLGTMDLINKGEEFSRLKGVIHVGVVTGRYDLMVTVLLNREFDLLTFYSEEVAKVKDVQSVETFIVYKGYNLKVPYVL